MMFDAFRLHDELGFPLELSVDAGRANGVKVNLAAFACDALEAGWTKERIDATIQGARPDFVAEDFWWRMAMLYTLSGKKGLKAMKERIVSNA